MSTHLTMKAHKSYSRYCGLILAVAHRPKKCGGLDGSGADNVRPHVHLQSFRTIHSGRLCLMIFHSSFTVTGSLLAWILLVIVTCILTSRIQVDLDHTTVVLAIEWER